MSLYPMQVEELQNKEKKYNDNNKIKNVNNNYDININKALSAENRKIKKIKNPKKKQPKEPKAIPIKQKGNLIQNLKTILKQKMK